MSHAGDRLHACACPPAAARAGYSDCAIVYLNGERLYGGNATYRSRDYRFLGSIGLWDTIL